MNWEGEASKESANRGNAFTGPETGEFVDGAKWQRDQLRTDEAVERLALRLMNMMTPFDEWPTNKELGGGPTGDCDVEFKQAWMDETRATITALLGEE